ncbi:MAG: hypothetical protein JXC32_18230, partial [Anaerolineae bacterium]|nr:hypothetical protein [Anaerolineae bacterium]
SNYRRDVRDLGFRLRPALGAQLWEVLEPPALSAVTPQHEIADGWVGGRLEVVGYDLPATEVSCGDAIPITLYTRLATTETEILMPMARLGEVEQRWTTDSRRLTPEWRPGEIIAERYYAYVPFGLMSGDYPLTLSYANLSQSEEPLSFDVGVEAIGLGMVHVEGLPTFAGAPRVARRALTNIGNEVALTAVRARVGLSLRFGQWDRPLVAVPGQSLHLRLTWHVLAQPTASYTVFIHLIDSDGRLWYGHDYMPLGGAFPSYLWFPKWLAGQRVVDPYRLPLPEDLPSGTYWLEVGMYEMGSIRRVAQLDNDGTMTGDRLILGPVVVER